MRSKIITIKKEKFKGTRYMDNLNCVMANTLRDLGYNIRFVSGSFATIRGGENSIEWSYNDALLICEAYKNPKDIQVTIHFTE